MRRRFKSIFKKDAEDSTGPSDNASAKPITQLNNQVVAIKHKHDQTGTTDDSNPDFDQSAGLGSPVSTSLWDTAYNQLKEDEDTRQLLSMYEELLSRVPVEGQAAASSGVASQPGDDAIENRIPQKDVIARRKLLNEIAQAGRQYMETNQAKVTILGHEIKVQQGMGKAGKAVEWANTFISDAIKDLPYAPAVTAGISLILPLLTSPATVNDENLQGFAYVTSQMSYYAQLETQILPADMSPGLKAEMTAGVIELYRLIIEYQVRSVLRFYRNSTKNYFRSVVDYDGWQDQLDKLKEKETVLAKRFETVISSSSLAQLTRLSEDAKAMRQTLNSDLQKLVSLSRGAEERWSADDFRRWVDALKVVNPEHDKDRIQDEKGGLLRDSYRWVLNNDDFRKWRDEADSHLLWIKGDPGKGKTMLLCGIIDELSRTKNQNTNIAYFFCQATNSRIREASSVLRGLIYTLVHQQRSLITHLRDGRFDGDTAWFELRKVLVKILEDPNLEETYLFIDALDECEVDLDKLLDFLSQSSSAYPRVKWIVSSRNWQNIEECLETARKSKLSLELNKDTVSAAVYSFIEDRVKRLSETKHYEPEIRDAVHQYLTSNAEGTFLWVALVCKRLTKVARWNVRKALEDSPPGLNGLYSRMLDQINQSEDADYCKSILSVAMIVFRPITLDELGSCIDLPEELKGNTKDLVDMVGNCGSFLTLQHGVISLVHQSAKDFLLDDLAYEMIFPQGSWHRHYSIFLESMRAMSGTLRRDIYGLVEPGFPISQVEQQDPDPLAAVRYTCVHWIEHFQQSLYAMNMKEDLQDSGLVGKFFQQDYLHWLEALSLLGSIPAGVASMLELQTFVKTLAENDSYLTKRIQDACRFILYFKTGIESYPLQAYNSALVFSPTRSITRNQYEKDKPTWLKQEPVVEEDWDTCLHIFEGHTGSVNSVAFSHDSKLLATGSSDRTIKLWNSRNGECLHTLEGHHEKVIVVAFSHDYQFLGSVARDRTVKLWDTKTGHCMHTLEGYGARTYSVTISPNLQLLACRDDPEMKSIAIWNINQKNRVRILRGHSSPIIAITFSHDSKLLVSSSKESIKIWDSSSGECLQTLMADNDEDGVLALSPDSKLLAAGSTMVDGIKLFDCTSGKRIHLLNEDNISGSSGPIMFSPDSELLSFVRGWTGIELWHVRSGMCLRTFKRHGYAVQSFAFSHDSWQLASGGADATAKVWDIGSPQNMKASQGHTDFINCVRFSADSKLVVSCSEDTTIKVWNTSDGHCIRTFLGHRNQVQSVIFSHDSQLICSHGGMLENVIKLWNTSNGRCIQTLESHEDWVRCIAFSCYSDMLASASEDQTVKVWSTSDGQLIQTLNGCHTESVTALAFSGNSELLALGTLSGDIQLWDLNGSQCIRTLRGGETIVECVVFSHDPSFLASQLRERTVRIWNTDDGSCLSTILMADLLPDEFPPRHKTIQSFDFSAGYVAHDIGIIRFDPSVHKTQLAIESEAQIPTLEGPSVSPDETFITWNSMNLLWLPLEYRPWSVTVSRSKVVIACPSGQMLFFDLDSHKLSDFLARH